MNIVRAKIHNGQFVNLAQGTDGKWRAQIQVPADTSYFQPDHKYGIQFEAWDEDNNHIILDRTDATFGSQLAVRVRERVTPIITLISPTSPYVIEESAIALEFTVTDLGGSTLDLDSVKVVFGDNEFYLDDQYMTVTAITNGINVKWEPPYVIQDGEYNILIEAKDYDENTTRDSFTVIVDTDPCEFVFDRTQADVDYVKALREKYLNGTITAEEKEAYAQPLKGARNKSDFERIITAIVYLCEMFELDYTLAALPEIPRESWVQDLRDVVDNMRSSVPIHENTPFTPNLPINTYKKMNDLEKILFDMHENLNYRFVYYCDDGLYMDATIGTLE